jgi:hypothetical protein
MPLLATYRSSARVVALLECEANYSEWKRAEEANGRVCAVSYDEVVTCLDAAESNDIETLEAELTVGEIVDIGVFGDSVGLLNASGELWFWAASQLVQTEGVFSQIDWNYAIDQYGRIVVWTESEGSIVGTPGPAGIYRGVSVFTGGACALDVEGEIVCWMDEASQGAVPQMYAAPPAGPFTRLEVSSCGACASRERAGLFCWQGDTEVRQWGKFSGLSASAFDVSGCQICALDLSTTVCWSEDDGVRRGGECRF